MRKLLFLLLCIPTLLLGQWKISDHKAEIAFGYPVTYRLYLNPDSSNHDFVFVLHGIGEIGPITGEKLDLVEKIGYPKKARAGFPFRFNIIAFQSAVTNFNDIKKSVITYFKLKYKMNHIFVTGYSMGGVGTYEILAKVNDPFSYIDGAGVVCGRFNITTASTLRDIPIRHYHGDKDGTVSYNSAVASVNAYNLSHLNKDSLITYAGVGHDAWNFAYLTDPGKDDLLQFIYQIFSRPRGDEAFKRDVEIFLQSAERTKNDLKKILINHEQAIYHLDSAIHKY